MKTIEEISRDYKTIEKVELGKMQGGQQAGSYDDSDQTYIGRNGDCYVRGDNGAPSGYEIW